MNKCPCCGQAVQDSPLIENEKYRTVVRGNVVVRFSPTEWAIWKCLRNASDSVEHEALFVRVYGLLDVGENNITVHISKMRKKLKPLGWLIKNDGWGGRGSTRRTSYKVVRNAA
jgi:DNA-binding response OmpR family regulator